MPNLITPEQILSDLIKDRNKDPVHTQELIAGYAQVIRDWCRGVIGEDDGYSIGNGLNLRLERYLSRNELRAEQRERAGIK